MILIADIYVLLVIFFTPTAVEVELHEFNSKVTCIVAMDHVLRQPTNKYRSVYATCTPK